MPYNDQYFLGHSPVEQKRLQQQAEELAGESERLFDQIGLTPGSRVVEIGCALKGASNFCPTASVRWARSLELNSATMPSS